MLSTTDARNIEKAICAAEPIVLEQFKQGQIETEPSFTDRLIGSIDTAIKGIFLEKYRLSIRTLRDRGPNSPEREFGADLASLLYIDTKEQKLSKGFLAQAKMANKNEIKVDYDGYPNPAVSVKLKKNDPNNQTSLISQCNNMLAITPDSFVLVYAKQDIIAIPASTIASITEFDSRHHVYYHKFKWFIRHFLWSFIGDMRMYAHDDSSLRNLANIMKANMAILLQVKDKNIDSQ